MTRPPLPWLIAYRVFAVRLPDEYRAWVAADIASKGFVNWRVARTYLSLVVLIGLYSLAQWQVFRAPTWQRVRFLLLAAGVIALLGSRNTYVRRALRWQRIDRHGRAAAPKGLGLLSNREAGVLAAVVLTAFTAGSAVFAHGLRPSGCDRPDGDVMARLRAGLKDSRTQIVEPQAVPFGDGQLIVAAAVRPVGVPQRFVFWLVDGEAIYEVSGAQVESSTTFSRPPSSDRIGADALVRSATCLQDSLRR